MRRYYKVSIFFVVVIVVACHGNTFKEEKKHPEIVHGSSCTVGKIYRFKCNICRCSTTKRLICTKMRCFDEKQGQKDNTGLNKDIPTVKNAIEEKAVPSTKVVCTPGKIYEDQCRTCFCHTQSGGVCTEPMDCRDGGLNLSNKHKKLRHLFKKLDLQNLPVLNYFAEACTPGESYRLDCNACICLQDGTLVCDSHICPHYEEMNRRELDKHNGRACEQEALAHDEQMQECIHCACRRDRYECQLVPGCVPEWMRDKYHSLNIEEERCEPGGIYRSYCNKCFCQADGALHCTQKGCLNYKQTQELLERHKALEKSGL